MSKRLIASSTILAGLLFLGLNGAATESGPSNTVGFWKLEVGRGFTQISFPLLPADKSVNNVLGSQLTGGTTSAQSDQVLRWNAATGQFQMCWYNTAQGSWQGDFDRFSESESYWIYVQPDHPVTQTIVTFGNVVEVPYFNMGSMGPGYNAIGSVWAIAAPVSLAGLNGFLGGMYLFQSDLLMGYDAATGNYTYAWRTENGNWQGNLTQLEPLHGYWIYVAPGHPGFNWSTYPQPLMIRDDYLGPQNTSPFNQRVLTPPGQYLPGLTPPTPAAVGKTSVRNLKTQGGEQ